MDVKINVYNQHLELNNSYIVKNSQNYVHLIFDIKEGQTEWAKCDKVALFENGTGNYAIIVDTDDNGCIVPAESLTDSYVDITLIGTYGTTRITTDRITIRIKETGYRIGIIAEPQADVYAQILNKLKEIQAGTVTDDAIKKAIANSSSGGTTVIQGEKGEKGDKGDTGASAYELAKAEGYTGTQTQWLESLKGEKGDTGATGPQGIQGEKGEVGPQGERGPQGIQGEVGATGAVGPQGEKGEKGDTGAAGPQGPKGDKGDTGAKGEDATLMQIVDLQNDSATDYTLDANKFYIFGEKTKLNISLADADDKKVANEYLLQFTSGATPTEFTYPDTIKFVQEFEVEANKTYQVSILNNIGVIGGVANE